MTQAFLPTTRRILSDHFNLVCISPTQYWIGKLQRLASRSLSNNVLLVSAAKVCHLHQARACTFGMSCNFVHICRKQAFVYNTEVCVQGVGHQCSSISTKTITTTATAAFQVRLLCVRPHRSVGISPPCCSAAMRTVYNCFSVTTTDCMVRRHRPPLAA